MDSDKTCTVNFTKEVITPPPDDDSEYKLSVALGGTGTGSVTSEPTGIDCGTKCSENYQKDVPVTLTATPADGSQFDVIRLAGVQTLVWFVQDKSWIPICRVGKVF